MQRAYNNLEVSTRFSYQQLRPVESVLLHCCESWTVTPTLEVQLDGCNTRTLRIELNIHWAQHIINSELSGELQKLPDKIRERRMHFAGPLLQGEHEPGSRFVRWFPKHRVKKPGRPATQTLTSRNMTQASKKRFITTAMQYRKVGRP